MSILRWTITAVALSITLWAYSTSAQVRVRVGDQPSSPTADPGMVEAAIHLELYGHPHTARRHIDVIVRHKHIELAGIVATDQERLTALQAATRVAPDFTVDDRIQVKADPSLPQMPLAENGSPLDIKRRFMEALAGKFPDEVVRELVLTAYRIDLPLAGSPNDSRGSARGRTASAWVVVLEGLAPSVQDQLAMSELLLFEPPFAAAVVNRTFVADGFVPEYKPKVHVRVPFVHVDVGHDDGVDVRVGPLVVRTGGGFNAAGDRDRFDEFMTAVRSDPDLRDSPLRPHLMAGVLTIDGTLTAADKMRAIAIANRIPNIRGVVDRINVVNGQPPYYNRDDLLAYLRFRLGEHANARNVDLVATGNHRLQLDVVVPTGFHAALAATVIAQDPAISRLPLEPAFRDMVSGAILTLGR